jgi:hypothetical protein
MKKKYSILAFVAISGLCSLTAMAQPPLWHPRDFPHHRNSSGTTYQFKGTPDGPSRQYESSGARPSSDYNSTCDELCHEQAWLDGDRRLLEEP